MYTNDEEKTVEGLLAELDQILSEAKAVPITEKVLVDRKFFQDTIQEIRFLLPSEIERANSIIDREDSIIKNAQSRVDAMIAEAEVKRNRLVDQDEVTQEALRQAETIVNDSRKMAYEICQSANQYADDLLQRASKRFANIQDIMASEIEKCVETIQTKSQDMVDSLLEQRDSLDVACEDIQNEITENRQELNVTKQND